MRLSLGVTCAQAARDSMHIYGQSALRRVPDKYPGDVVDLQPEIIHCDPVRRRRNAWAKIQFWMNGKVDNVSQVTRVLRIE